MSVVPCSESRIKQLRNFDMVSTQIESASFSDHFKRNSVDAVTRRCFRWCRRRRNLTSRAETNCRGRRVAFRSCVLLSRSNRAPAMEVSSSEGLCRDGELRAILLTAAMVSNGVLRVVLVEMSAEGRCSHIKKPNGNLLWDRHFRLGCNLSVLGLACFLLRGLAST